VTEPTDAANWGRVTVTMTVTVATVSSATTIGDSQLITASLDLPPKTFLGKTGVNGLPAPSAVVEPAPGAVAATASGPSMAEGSAPLPPRPRPSHVTLLPAGPTLGSGASALCHAEAQEPKPGPSPALSQRMEARPVHQRTFKRNLSLVMPQPVGQTSLTGQHAKVSVVKMETRPGKGHASSPKMEASHAQRKQLKHRHKSVEQLASG